MTDTGLIGKVKKAYKGSFLGKERKDRNIVRAILQNILLSYLILLLCQLIFILANSGMVDNP